MQKTMHFALHFYAQKTMHFLFRFLCTKALHSALHFYKKNIYTLGSVFICKSYRIVLLPNYKRTHDQSNQIEK